MGSDKHTDDTPRPTDISQAGIKRMITDFFKPIGEVFKALWEKCSGRIIFLIIPVIFLINATAIHYNVGRFFMNNVDPEYFFLYNGVIIGEGSLSVQYTSNPGTPLMFLIALSTRILSLFQPEDYIGDVVNDPEKYIHAANMLLILLLAGTLFIGGLYIRKVSGSRVAGLLFQLSLPGSAALMILSGMLKAEVMTMLPVLFLGVAVFHYVFSDADQDKTSNATLVLFGLITGFGMACKLTFIPMILIPLILLKTNILQKIKLLGYTTLSFAIFAYPVVFNNGHFWKWVGDIISHTGKYGAGQEGFIDMASIPRNLEQLFNNERTFFYTTGFSLILGIFLLLRYHNRQISSQAGRLMRAILAVSVAIIVCVALILKHFEVHYFSSFYGLKFLLISLIFLLIIRFERINQLKAVKIIFLGLISAAVICISVAETLKIREISGQYMERKAMQDEKYQKVMSGMEAGSPVILTCPHFGSPFIEYAHYAGILMSFHLRGSFLPYLKSKFPVSYLYVPWSGKFYFWSDFVDFQQILDKTQKSFFIYIGATKSNDLPAIEARIWQVLDRNAVSIEVVYQDDKTGEQLIKMTMLPKSPDASF